MLKKDEIKVMAGFYENELVNRFLHYWIPRCVDHENGGFVNCFNNEGTVLVSKDKYIWSQGRFVWVFAKLASIEAPIFSQQQRDEFLALAKHGADFLMAHCLMGENDWRCVFLLDEKGNPKYVDGYDKYDMSVYADCFASAGLLKYATASHDQAAYSFGKKLYESIVERVAANTFETLPYPLSKTLRAHGIPMILSNVTKDMYYAAQAFEPEIAESYKGKAWKYSEDILTHFVDENNLLHEVITADNQFIPEVLGQHINPGHTLEDAWFMLDSQELAGRDDYTEKICDMVLKAAETGWDDEFGGIYHFADVRGGEPRGENSKYAEEAMSKQLSGWGDKLWWVHSESLYSLLRCYFLTGEPLYYQWYQKVFEYTYRTFPNPDPEVREWKQIRNRDGSPVDRVVALPVKDPYHVTRNLILLIELLYRQLEA